MNNADQQASLEIPSVRESCARVVAVATHLRVDESAIERFAQKLARDGITIPVDDLALEGSADEIANFVLVTDALNFCFFSGHDEEPWSVTFREQQWTRTMAMVAGMLRAIDRDRAWLTAKRWKQASADDVATIFAGPGRIPLPKRRLEILRETGTILSERYDGQFARLIEATSRDAFALALQLAKEFPSFHDVATYNGEPVAFLKRAQICAADLHRMLTDAGHPGLINLAALTVFADYRLPQLFRHEGMMILEDGLANHIDREVDLPAGSAEEIEIRAATIDIGERICTAMSALGHSTEAWQLDYELWRRAREPQVKVPHHRTLTWYY